MDITLNSVLNYDNVKYKVLKDAGLGFRKKAFVAVNLLTKESVMVFIPSVTKQCNNLELNKLHFLNDIDTIEDTYKLYPNICKILPLFTSKNDYIIISHFISGKPLYSFLCN